MSRPVPQGLLPTKHAVSISPKLCFVAGDATWMLQCRNTADVLDSVIPQKLRHGRKGSRLCPVVHKLSPSPVVHKLSPLYSTGHNLKQLSQMGRSMPRNSCCLCRSGLPKLLVVMYAIQAYFTAHFDDATHNGTYYVTVLGKNWGPKKLLTHLSFSVPALLKHGPEWAVCEP